MDAPDTQKIIDHLWLWAGKSKQRRNAYWDEYYSYYAKNNWLSIPLIIVSSVASIVSVANVATVLDPAVLGWVTVSLSFTTSVLAALQRYFRYGERAEQCKAIAKNYTRIAYNIEFTNNIFSVSDQRDMTKLADFTDMIRKDLEILINETNDIPSIINDETDAIHGNTLTSTLSSKIKHSVMPPGGGRGDDDVENEACCGSFWRGGRG